MEEARLLESLHHMTKIGNLADDVVRAALAIQRGGTPRDASVLAEASELLSAAAAQIGAPLDVTSSQVDSETMGVLSTFNRFAAQGSMAGEPAKAEPPTDDVGARLTHAALVLERMRNGQASPDEVEEIRQQFEVIGRLTLTAANEAVKPKMNLSAWTPTLKS